MDKKYRILIILLLFFALVFVRAFERHLFYDPFIDYFNNDYLYKTIPIFSSSKLLASLIFRYGMNTVISLFIIYIAFQNKSFVKFAVKFYMIAFVILVVIFFIILRGELAHGYLFAFNIRRFLIQPLLCCCCYRPSIISS